MRRSTAEATDGHRPLPSAVVGVSRRRAVILLVGILVGFAVVAAWNLGNAGFSGFSSTAARSMSVSPRAFWFGAFDPAASITLDKLSGFLVPQALSARLFGFHAWSLALPQVVEGLVTIVVVFVIGTRWRGRSTGLLAALAFAVTPLMVSLFGHTMEDGLLTMSLALAFASFQKGVVTGRTLPLVFAGLWIAVGFQAKMLQAWFIVPALVIAVVVTTAPPRVRLLRALLLGAVTVAASLSWMGIVQLVPAADRPFFDGSVSNDVFASVFGYNGLDRFVPGIVPGAAPAFSASVIAPGADGRSPFKLLLPAFTTQVGWFYPLALLGLVTAVVRLRSGAAPPSLRAVDTGAASAPLVIGLGGWLVTAAAVLTVAPVPHTAYLAAVTVPVSLLAAIAVGDAVMAARRGRPASLFVVIAAETLWTVGILVGTGLSPAWLLAFVSVCGAAALVLAGSTRIGPSTLASVAAGLAMLAAPGVWTVSTVDPALAGTANDAYAGPRVGSVPYFFQTDAPESERRSFSRFALLPPDLSQPDPQLTDEQRNLADFVRRSPGHDGAPLFTTSTWQDAEPYILAGGLDVRALGGYSGAVPSPTLASIRRGIRQQATSYFLFPARPPTGRIPDTESQRIVAWVTGRCSYVPDDVYEGATTLPGQSLWACTRGT